jgi:hypothetical protein
VENTFAQKFEQKRADYQLKLVKLFEQVQEENKVVDELMTEASKILKEDKKMPN